MGGSMLRIISRNVCTAKSTTESITAISHKIHNVEKRNPYQSKNRRRRREPKLASLLCPAYSISYQSRRAKAVCW